MTPARSSGGTERSTSGDGGSFVTEYVAFLRGINVGGKNKVPMAELRAASSASGYLDVRTSIQSGNVVFAVSGSESEESVVGSISRLLFESFGIDTTAILRQRTELATILRACPFAHPERDLSRLLVFFLDREPPCERVAELDCARSAEVEFAVRGREVHGWYPEGSGNSKFTADYFGRTLGVTATGRNHRTITRIIGLMTATSMDGEC